MIIVLKNKFALQVFGCMGILGKKVTSIKPKLVFVLAEVEFVSEI